MAQLDATSSCPILIPWGQSLTPTRLIGKLWRVRRSPPPRLFYSWLNSPRSLSCSSLILFLLLDFGVWRAKLRHCLWSRMANKSHEQEREFVMVACRPAWLEVEGRVGPANSWKSSPQPPERRKEWDLWAVLLLFRTGHGSDTPWRPYSILAVGMEMQMYSEGLELQLLRWCLCNTCLSGNDQRKNSFCFWGVHPQLGKEIRVTGLSCL